MGGLLSTNILLYNELVELLKKKKSARKHLTFLYQLWCNEVYNSVKIKPDIFFNAEVK